MNVLDRIVAAKRLEVESLRGRAQELRAGAESAPAARPFAAALRRRERVTLLAEVKRRSPSAGWIREGAEPVEIASAYASAGASAVSVLTDADYFGGSLGDLVAVRGRVELPVLRKDFVVDALQLWQARAAGADAALLIVRILDDAALSELLALTSDLGMDALVEVHDGAELERALRAGAEVIGVNNRDLATFTTDLETTLRLAASVPGDRVLVAESGIRTGADVERLGAAGVNAVLVGETLMRAPEVGAAARSLVGLARAARPGEA